MLLLSYTLKKSFLLCSADSGKNSGKFRTASELDMGFQGMEYKKNSECKSSGTQCDHHEGSLV